MKKPFYSPAAKRAMAQKRQLEKIQKHNAAMARLGMKFRVENLERRQREADDSERNDEK